jgi:histidinol-phosphate phosphatase family protein
MSGPEGSTDRPTQAVIVAGGRGTRLGRLTEDRPKPMVEVAGRPFLGHLLELLRDRGFRRVLVLLGYRADVVEAYVGDGSRFGLEVRTATTPPDDETGRRIRAARELLEPRFLFMYGDNWWPLPIDQMWRRYREAGFPAQVTVYRNADGRTRDNVRIDAAGRVEDYDRTRTAPGLGGVEIGYAILERGVISALPDRNEPLEALLYPPLVARHELGAFVTDHRYYSIGSPERLPPTEAFLRGAPAVILDRDGVLNRRPPRAEYVRRPEEFHWLPGALEALRLLSESGHRVFVVSNQAGIARGAMTADDLAAIERRMVVEVEAAGGRIDGFYYCPHDWDEGCECRKPRPGMLFAAQHDHDLDLSRTPFVGDDERDAQAAEAAGSPAMLVDEEHGVLDVVRGIVAAGTAASSAPGTAASSSADPAASSGRSAGRPTDSVGSAA